MAGRTLWAMSAGPLAILVAEFAAPIAFKVNMLRVAVGWALMTGSRSAPAAARST